MNKKFISFVVLAINNIVKYFKKEGNFISVEYYIKGRLVKREKIHFVTFIFQPIIGMTEQEKNQITKELFLS